MSKFSILFGGNFCEQQLVLAREALKHSDIDCHLCKFRLHAHNPWLIIVLKCFYKMDYVCRNFQCVIWNNFHKSRHIILWLHADLHNFRFICYAKSGNIKIEHYKYELSIVMCVHFCGPMKPSLPWWT